MLCRNNYSQDYIDDARAKIDAQVAAYKALASTVSGKGLGPLEAFEPVFFNNLVLVLEGYFVHRARGLEKKDGNALNEVRVLCSSLMSNDGVMGVDSTIRMRPESTVLKYEVGDEITLSEDDFSRLAKAFFSEIERKYL